MRIITGKYGRRKFNAKIPAGVRPTAENVRESIFNILSNLVDFDDKIVADICAGTGAMGFEALSRGSVHCFFIEKNKKVVDFILSAATYIGIATEDHSIIHQDAIKFLSDNVGQNSLKFDIIFFDPPYNSPITNELLNLGTTKLNISGFIIIEYASNKELAIPRNLVLTTERLFGTTKVGIYQYVFEE